jgi:hypothetical protein
MRQQRHAHTRASLFSVETPSAEIQIVATHFGLVLDLQAENIDTDGHARRCHAVARLPIDVAMRLGAAIQNAVDAAWGTDDLITERSDPRQTALWSQHTFVEPLTTGAVCQPISGPLATYGVADPGNLTLEFSGRDVSARYRIAATAGRETCASCLRQFDDPPPAVAWLQEREPAPAEAGRLSYSAPGRRRVVA